MNESKRNGVVSSEFTTRVKATEISVEFVSGLRTLLLFPKPDGKINGHVSRYESFQSIFFWPLLFALCHRI